MSAAKEANAKFDLAPVQNPPSTENPPSPGIAHVTGAGKVKAGKAPIKVSCAGGPCQGTFKLTAKLKKGKGKAKNVVIGKGSFSLASGASTTLKIKLSALAKRALADGKALKAKVTGSGVQAGTVKLKSA